MPIPTLPKVSLGSAATQTAGVAAAAAAAVLPNTAGGGYLVAILVTATGTAALPIYDNAAAASGTIIGYVPANAAAGSIYTLAMPYVNGIYVGSGANSPAVTIAYA